jgi:bacteriocin biosynthesis cyclodehydratase domain-containing protein
MRTMRTAPGPARPLPRTLRLPPHRSVLRLGDDARLLGLDPASSVVVDALPAALADMLDELRDPVERSRLVARAVHRGADPGQAQALLDELVAAGALVDAAVPDRRAGHRAQSTVVVTGDGPLAVGIVVGLVHAGVGTVHVETGGTVLAGDVGTGYLDADRGRDRLAATRAAVRRLRPAAGTGPPPLRLVPDLVVLADAVTPDPGRVAALHVTGTAHLPARLRDGTGVVGPLVLPGRTACLGCLELHRCARDPEWPTVAAQLVGSRGRADPACAAATAALAVAQALAALDATVSDGCAPPSLEATLELDPAAAALTRRGWTPRPDCGCGAAGVHGGTGHRPVSCADRPDGETIAG